MTRIVQDVMTAPAIGVAPSAEFKEMVRLMQTNGVSALPVIDEDGRPVGVVSEADLLLKEEYVGRERVRGHKRERSKASGQTAEQLMTSPAVTIGPQASLAEAARVMHERGVKRLPVVGVAGRLVGIVSRSDLLTVFLRPDREIFHEVVDRIITGTLWVEPDTIRVDVRHGVVTLEGQLERKSLMPILIGLVEGVDGVVGVDPHLTYERDDTSTRPEGRTPWSVLPRSIRV
jgi:CBS domain-containing protein